MSSATGRAPAHDHNTSGRPATSSPPERIPVRHFTGTALLYRLPPVSCPHRIRSTR
ncbi:hypothetical protein AB0L97_22960 [Nocardia sp. NPDC051911]|uniref:hypothetical protein n=1 Tax=Nocardia sp. NPDC051911 TaxID=3154648 RepID=UPI0034405703